MRLIKAEPLMEFFGQKRIEWFDLDIGASTAYDIAKQAVEEEPTVGNVDEQRAVGAGQCVDDHLAFGVFDVEFHHFFARGEKDGEEDGKRKAENGKRKAGM